MKNMTINKSILNGLNGPVIILDNSNRVIDFNSYFTAEFNRYTAVAVNMHVDTIIENMDVYVVKNEESEVIINAIKNPTVFDAKGELKIKLSREWTFYVNIQPVNDYDSNLPGRVISFFDISEYKNLLDSMEAKCKMLQKLNDKSELITSSMQEQIKAKLEENNRFIKDSLTGIFTLILKSIEPAFQANRNVDEIHKKLGKIIELANTGITDPEYFMLHMEQKKDEFISAIEKYKTELSSIENSVSKETGLDEKEIRILALIADCRSNREIALELNYEEDTIKNKITAIRNKLHLKDRCHLVSYAYRHGLV